LTFFDFFSQLAQGDVVPHETVKTTKVRSLFCLHLVSPQQTPLTPEREEARRKAEEEKQRNKVT
jgi:hypothetical protein